MGEAILAIKAIARPSIHYNLIVIVCNNKMCVCFLDSHVSIKPRIQISMKQCQKNIKKWMANMIGPYL